MTEQERFMKEAIRQARKAGALEEVPIGCVIVHEGKIIARGYNRRNTDKNTLSHAELNAIKKASKRLGDWRLEGCTMYVTLEPCQMCSGALMQSRIDEVVIGSMNPKAGCAGSVMNLLEMEGFNHKVKVTRGVLEEECAQMLSGFFQSLREKKKEQRLLEKRRAELERSAALQGVIFDVDGTLLDSVPVWMDAASRWLLRQGITPEENLGKKLFSMTMEEAAAYIKKAYSLSAGEKEIICGVTEDVRRFYFEEAQLKPGARELLEWLAADGKAITAATASDFEMVEGAFQRLGILGYFQRIFTCTEAGKGKNSPRIYEMAARYMGTEPEKTCVIEDSLHALRTAKKAGFYTAGVFDEASSRQQEQLKKEGDLYGKSPAELLEKFRVQFTGRL